MKNQGVLRIRIKIGRTTAPMTTRVRVCDGATHAFREATATAYPPTRIGPAKSGKKEREPDAHLLRGDARELESELPFQSAIYMTSRRSIASYSMHDLRTPQNTELCERRAREEDVPTLSATGPRILYGRVRMQPQDRPRT